MKWDQHYYLVSAPCRLSTDPKMHDFEWPFYVQFSIFTIRNCVSAIRLHTYRSLVELFIEYFCTMSPAKMCGRRQWNCDPQNIAAPPKDCGFFVDEKVRAIHRRNLKIIIILFNALSSLHWLQNSWPWMTLNGHFTLNFHYHEQAFDNFFLVLHTYLWACLYHVTSGDVRKRTVIRRIFGIRGRTADLS